MDAGSVEVVDDRAVIGGASTPTTPPAGVRSVAGPEGARYGRDGRPAVKNATPPSVDAVWKLPVALTSVLPAPAWLR